MKAHRAQDAATLVGKKIAELCKAKSISKVCFDRGGFVYHGRVQVSLRVVARIESIREACGMLRHHIIRQPCVGDSEK